MKRVFVLGLGGLVAFGSLLALNVPTARAFPDFKKEFDAYYVKQDPTTDQEKALKSAVETAKCNVCHMGDSKKMKNDYGKALDELLTKDDKKDSAKIKDAFKKVESMKASNGSNFGDNIKAGKLPAGG